MGEDGMPLLDACSKSLQGQEMAVESFKSRGYTGLVRQSIRNNFQVFITTKVAKTDSKSAAVGGEKSAFACGVLKRCSKKSVDRKDKALCKELKQTIGSCYPE